MSAFYLTRSLFILIKSKRHSRLYFSVRESIYEVSDVFEALYKSYKHTQRINHFQTKSNSYRDIAIRPHHPLHSKKKQKCFKHINKVPRMQGSPEMKRAVFRQRCCKLHTDSENSDTNEEKQANESKKSELNTEKHEVATTNRNFIDSKDEHSSSCNSSDETSNEGETSAVPLSEAIIRQVAKEFHSKTILLTLH